MQDEGLDVIVEGLDTLKNMAHDMNEILDGGRHGKPLDSRSTCK